MGRVFNPAVVNDRSWLKEFAQAPCTLIFDDFVRVYFSCRPPADAEGQYVSYTGYIDLDRGNLFRTIRIAEQPILPLGDRGMFDEFGVYPTSVIRWKGRVRAYYGGWTRCSSVPFNVAIGCAESSDGGNTFTRLGPGPVISYSPDEPFILSGPKVRLFNGKWYLFYISGSKWLVGESRPEPVYRIRFATSDDGINWTKGNRDIIPPVLEVDECQASPDVFFDGSLYHMFFCYRYSLNYRNKERGYRIGYAFSHDLNNWQRNDSMAGLDVGPDEWDSEMVSYPHVFELDGATYMFYLGNQVGRHGFGLAQLGSIS